MPGNKRRKDEQETCGRITQNGLNKKSRFLSETGFFYAVNLIVY